MTVVTVGFLVVTVVVVLAQWRRHLFMAGWRSGLHQSHAGQHSLTAQQPSLPQNTDTNKHTQKQVNTHRLCQSRDETFHHFFLIFTDHYRAQNFVSSSWIDFQLEIEAEVTRLGLGAFLLWKASYDTAGLTAEERDMKWKQFKMQITWEEKHWPISCGLGLDCWKAVTSQWCVCVCWGERESASHWAERTDR